MKKNKMKHLVNFILTPLLLICFIDIFYDLPYVYANTSGIISGISALFLNNITDCWND